MAGKVHQKRKAGRKATKKKAKDQKRATLGAGSSVAGGAAAVTTGLGAGAKAKKVPKTASDPGANPKAFAFSSAGKAKASQARSAEKEQRRLHGPVPERAGGEPPPLLVLVHGPPKVGKTSLIKGLVKHYTKQNLADPKGPLTLVTGKKRRITLLECPPDLPGMMDAAKVADLVLLLIDGSFGLEMETFEFLNLLQVHGFPKVMGVLTHLDGFKEPSKLKKAKKALKARFWSEVYDGAKLFYLSGMQHGKYLKREILNLARFISVAKTRPLSWRLAHPYLIADRLEDVTPAEPCRLNPKADRELLLYGYLRGAPLKQGARLHLAGVGDFDLQDVDGLPDPCPLPFQANGDGTPAAAPSQKRRRSLSEKERLIHAPMSDLGGMLFDRDAVYIDLPDWKVQYSNAAAAATGTNGPAAAAAAAAAAGSKLQEGEEMVRKLQATRLAVDEKLSKAKIQLFSGGSSLPGNRQLKHEDAGYDMSEDDITDADDDQSSSDDLSSEDEGSGSEQDEVSEDEQQQHHRTARFKLPGLYESVQQGSRVRRRALLYDDAAAAAAENGNPAAGTAIFEGEHDEEDERHEYQQYSHGSRREKQREDEHADSDEDDDAGDVGFSGEDVNAENEGMGAAAAWKSRIQERVASLFAARGADLVSFVYGTRATAAGPPGVGPLQQQQEQQQQQQQLHKRARWDLDDVNDSGSDEEDFFMLKVPGSSTAAPAAAANEGLPSQQQQQHRQSAATMLDAVDALDSSRPFAATAAAAATTAGNSGVLAGVVPTGPGFNLTDLNARWSSQHAVEGVRDRFVTGDWDAAAARSAALPGDDGSNEGDGSDADDGEMFGDFEDVETGVSYQVGDAVTAAAQQAITEARAEELRAKKLAKRAAWEAGYAEGGAAAAGAAAAAVERGGAGARPAGSDDDEGDAADGAAGARKAHNPNRKADEGESFFDAQKRELAVRAAATAAALAQLDPKTRLAMAGHPVGSYVRLRLTGVPCELVQHWNPTRPLLVGGLGQGEQRMGVLRLRFKRHRWFPKTLKTRDPLVLSVGWRRFQTLPVYALEDHNRRLRSLKYTPQHCHCLAAAYAPLAPPNTGVVAIQASAAGPVPPATWRIAATAVVLEQEAELRVVKKLKLVGAPINVAKHSAFVGGMFTSQLEAARFEGAAVTTVSGIRGTIKKAIRAGVNGVPDGGVRITFEDKPLLSDIVFLRAWVAVDIPKLYNVMTNLLAPTVKPANAVAVFRKGHDKQQQEEGQQQQAAMPALQAVPQQQQQAAAAAGQGSGFAPSANFAGARPGYVFKMGGLGLGYYKDQGPLHPAAASAAAIGMAAAAAATAAAGTSAVTQTAGTGGWVGMRTVAELRRAAGVGAPRVFDSLYKPIERAPRVFNPLKVPAKLQAALPFKTKPKVEAPRKRKTLEHKRAVVLEKNEKRAVTLLQQLNAIRNVKAEKRRQQSAKRREVHAKKQAKEAEWRDRHNKEQRKERYVQQGQAAKRAAAVVMGNSSGKFSKKQKTRQ